MKTCTIFGQNAIIDNIDDIDRKIRDTITSLLEKDEDINFVFLSSFKNYNDTLKKDYFKYKCFSIISSMREINKHIKISLVLTTSPAVFRCFESPSMLASGYYRDPYIDYNDGKGNAYPCLRGTGMECFDEYINMKVWLNNTHPFIKRGKWSIRKSDILLCYLYPSLHDTGEVLLSYAEKRNKKQNGSLEIINLACENTANFLWESRTILSEHYQEILAKGERVKQDLNYTKKYGLYDSRVLAHEKLILMALSSKDIRYGKGENLTYIEFTEAYKHHCILCNAKNTTVIDEVGFCSCCQSKVIELANKFACSQRISAF